MNIAIISDTHLKKNSGQLDHLITEFRNVDLVIHAGDYGGVWVVEYCLSGSYYTINIMVFPNVKRMLEILQKIC